MINNLGLFKDYSDGSLKRVMETKDKRVIEMTLLFNKEDKDVVCVPTHHFCNLGCKMCHLTNNKLNKSMVKIKFDDFLEVLSHTVIDSSQNRITDKKKLLISFMGVGEPLLNLELLEQVFIHEDEIKERFGYESISYAVSSMMPNKNVLKLAELVNKYSKALKLHFSLHTPIDSDRKELIPSTNVSVEEALSLLIYYRNMVSKNEKFMSEYIKFHRTNDPIEIHYTLINGVNDGKYELDTIVSLLKEYKIPVKFIRFNPINELERSDKESLWIQEISSNIADLRIKTYSPPGREIGSSCGEFTKHYYHEEIETLEEKEAFLKFKKLHLVKE